nr:DMT family transporter [uncultured Merdimonas sp.]
MSQNTYSLKTKLILVMPVLSGIMWGSGGVFVRTFDSLGMDNFTMLFTRIIVSVTLLGVGLFLYDRSLLKIKLRDLWVFLGGGILGMFGINLTYNEAIKHGTLALASVLLSMSPLFVVTFSILFFHEKMTIQKGVCMAAALMGCVLVSGVLENVSGTSLSPIAVICGIGSAFFYALYSIFSKAAMKKGYHALTITFYCLVSSLILLVPGTDWACIGSTIEKGWPWMPWFMLLHSLVTSTLSYVFYTTSLSFIDAGTASILAASEPAAAMLFGFLFFSEQPTLLSISGLILTTAAIIILSRSQSKAS